MTNFKKGDKVFVLRTWDDRGTYTIRPCTVQSWGKQRVYLLDDASGKMTRTCYYTVELGATHTCVVAGDDIAAAQKKALELAAMYIAEKHAHYASRREQCPADAGFIKVLNKAEAELHEPRAILYPSV